jgi:hypothetical protein
MTAHRGGSLQVGVWAILQTLKCIIVDELGASVPNGW